MPLRNWLSTNRDAFKYSLSISSRQLVQVTPDNVDALFSDLSCEADVHSDTITELVKLYRDLPKDLFVSRILSDNSSDELRLKELRHSVFTELKTHQEFPFSASTELKRRKNTRLGESVAMKLCFDIFVLISVIEGAPFDDIKDIISVGKSIVSNDSVCSEQTKHNPCAANSDIVNPEITLLQNLIIDIQADILAMKHDSNELREEINAIKKDVKVIRGDLSQHAENVSSSMDAVRCSIDKVIATSQNGVTCVKNDIKQIRSDVSSLSDTITIQYEQLKETIAVVQKVEKRISRTDKKISSLEQRRETSYDQKLAHSVDTQDSRNHDVIHIRSDSDSEQHSNANPIDTATVSHLHRSPNTGRFTRVHSNETQMRETASNRQTTVFSKDIDLTHMFTNTKKDANTTHCATNNENSNRSTIQQGTAVVQDETVYQNNEEKSFIAEQYVLSAPNTQYHCPVSNRYSTLGDVSYEDNTTSYSAAVKGNINSRKSEQNSSTIPVVISRSREDKGKSRKDFRDQSHVREFDQDEQHDYDDCDDDFEMYVRRRTARFYLGGFRPTITEKVLRTIAKRRGVNLSWISIRRYDRQNRAVIRINVDSDKGHLLLREHFWPKGITCRRWYTKNQYNKFVNKHDYNNSDHYNGAEYADDDY